MLSRKQIDLLSEGLRHILNGDTIAFLQKMEIESNRNHTEDWKSESKEAISSFDGMVENIARELNGYFMRTFNNQLMAQIISKQFTQCVHEQRFDEVNGLQDDVEVMEESTILQHIMDQLGKSSVHKTLENGHRGRIQSKIQDGIFNIIWKAIM